MARSEWPARRRRLRTIWVVPLRWNRPIAVLRRAAMLPLRSAVVILSEGDGKWPVPGLDGPLIADGLGQAGGGQPDLVVGAEVVGHCPFALVPVKPT
ncbi:hypothetical protein GCM10022223_20160 [Kineosporia mesophila]|uniref:Uncharacterized protein n=1 Tax=Kineosporia mesophila TaxID=566012 RepID=A0ABP6ZF94_9ACTN